MVPEVVLLVLLITKVMHLLMMACLDMKGMDQTEGYLEEALLIEVLLVVMGMIPPTMRNPWTVIIENILLKKICMDLRYPKDFED